MSQAALQAALEVAARAPILLVASDFDGTLAPIVDDPARAQALPEALEALRRLVALPDTEVAVLTGRALEDFARRCPVPPGVRCVGSHGAEVDGVLAPAAALPEARALLEDLDADLRRRATGLPGALVESKPASVTFHYRMADPALAQEVVAALEERWSGRPGVFLRPGKKVLELAVLEADKGEALSLLRHRLGAAVAVYLGDDRTDEDVFTVLRETDVGVKVGEGDSSAPFRIDDGPAVVELLDDLAARRERWLQQSREAPIEDHALLSDQRTFALVTPTARVSWLCLPRLDSPALFAELLGGPGAGYFAVRPVDADGPPSQRYLPGTLVLETRWPTLTVTDFLDASGGRPGQRAGRSDLLRILRGRGRVRIEFAPRLDFGRVPTRLRVRDGGLVVEDSLQPLVLRAPDLRWEIVDADGHHTARTEVELLDEPMVLDLRHGTASLGPTRVTGPQRQQLSEQHWQSWAEQLVLPRRHAEAVRRSALVLRALTHAPSGAIAAAATTSLPEHLGGVRNWDYRFCWLRDASLSAQALVRLGSCHEALHFLDWTLGVLDRAEEPSLLRPLYTVGGDDVHAEAHIPELRGYAGSRPVRVGNAAAGQLQLDVFAPVVELVELLLRQEAPVGFHHWRLVEAMVHAVERRWKEPDHGIWEVRSARRHHVHSKVMCWLTVDRALSVARSLMAEERDDWQRLATAIAGDVLEHGWSGTRRSFTASYGSEDLDAAVLHVGLSGLLPPDDPRFAATVAAVQEHLQQGPLVQRYALDDGLPGREGGFLLCSFWLVEALVLLGRLEEAEALFDQLLELAGTTGLLPEEHDGALDRGLGNHPQAYSHAGVISSALALDAARERAGPRS